MSAQHGNSIQGQHAEREVAESHDRHFQELDDSDPAAACRGYIAQLASAGWCSKSDAVR